MEEASIIRIDLAKRSFRGHGAKADGSVAYRRKLSRGKLLSFLASQPKCTVAMEACAGAHYWGREIVALGHEVRLVRIPMMSSSDSDMPSTHSEPCRPPWRNGGP